MSFVVLGVAPMTPNLKGKPELCLLCDKFDCKKHDKKLQDFADWVNTWAERDATPFSNSDERHGYSKAVSHVYSKMTELLK